MYDNEIVSFIGGVSDLIRDAFKRGKYEHGILAWPVGPPPRRYREGSRTR